MCLNIGRVILNTNTLSPVTVIAVSGIEGPSTSSVVTALASCTGQWLLEHATNFKCLTYGLLNLKGHVPGHWTNDKCQTCVLLNVRGHVPKHAHWVRLWQ